MTKLTKDSQEALSKNTMSFNRVYMDVVMYHPPFLKAHTHFGDCGATLEAAISKALGNNLEINIIIEDVMPSNGRRADILISSRYAPVDSVEGVADIDGLIEALSNAEMNKKHFASHYVGTYSDAPGAGQDGAVYAKADGSQATGPVSQGRHSHIDRQNAAELLKSFSSSDSSSLIVSAMNGKNRVEMSFVDGTTRATHTRNDHIDTVLRALEAGDEREALRRAVISFPNMFSTRARSRTRGIMKIL